MNHRSFHPEIDTLIIQGAKDPDIWNDSASVQAAIVSSELDVNLHKLWDIRHLALSMNCISSLDGSRFESVWLVLGALMRASSKTMCPPKEQEGLEPLLPHDISIVFGETWGKTLN